MRLLLGVAILALTLPNANLAHAMPSMSFPGPALRLPIEQVRSYCKPKRVCNDAGCTKFLQCYTCTTSRVCLSADNRSKCKMVEKCTPTN